MDYPPSLRLIPMDSCQEQYGICHMASSPLGLGLAKGLVVYSLLAGGPPLVGKVVQPLQSVKSIRIAVSTVKDDLVMLSWYRLCFKTVYEMGWV